MRTHPLTRLYRRLAERYGPQGWWPLLAHKGDNPTSTGCHRGYHPGQYGVPDTPRGRFEVALGAVLTQNTVWTNVEKALDALAVLQAFTPEAMLNLDMDSLRAAIRPAGYYNVKARKLRCLAEFVQQRDPPLGPGCPSLENRTAATKIRPKGGRSDEVSLARIREAAPPREDLLGVWGIGPETADSIRLYAYHCLEMVVDAYTRRILTAESLCDPAISYEALKQYCREGVPATVPDYQEFHALMVEHGKQSKPG